MGRARRLATFARQANRVPPFFTRDGGSTTLLANGDKRGSGARLSATVTFFAGEQRLSGARVWVDGVTYQLDERGAAVVPLPVGERVFEAEIEGERVIRTINRHGASARFVVDFEADDQEHPFPALLGLVGDRFAIRSIVARGATGTVVQAWDRREEREVALRSPSEELSAREEANQVFLVEARNLAGLEHPNLLNIHEVLAVKGRGILVTEWASGTTLDRLMREGELSREDAWTIVVPLASGVSQLHREDIIHRDLHGANVIVREDAGPKLIDLGLARSLADVYLGASRVYETREHCAPEQFQGLHVTPATDVYQLTMLFYRIWSGRWPFESEDIEWAHVNEAPAPLPDAPEALQALVERGLAKQARRRFVDAGEWFRAFSGLREQLELEAELVRQAEKKWPVGLVAAVVAIVVLVSGAVAFYLGGADPRPEVGAEPAIDLVEPEASRVAEVPSVDSVVAPSGDAEVLERRSEAARAVGEALEKARPAAAQWDVGDAERVIVEVESERPIRRQETRSDGRSKKVKRDSNVTKPAVGDRDDNRSRRTAGDQKRAREVAESEEELAPTSGADGEGLLDVDDGAGESIFLPVE